ncbi:MAG: endonuclease MutS2 [Clostridia bacterium]|nr:endonuclease MutS2 [Clostridia bacterium]
MEFDKVREMLASCAATEGAREMARTLVPMLRDDREAILEKLGRTTDARRLIDFKGQPSFGGVKDVSGACERAEKGAVLSQRELLDIGNVLKTSRSLLDYIRTNKPFDTSLDHIFERLFVFRPLEDKIYRSIISEDMMADEASPALADIRRRIRIESNRIKETLQKYIAGGSYSKYLQENIVTMRNGRYVVPVRAEHKNEIKGMIHDTSSSGSTIFVEPSAVVDANNEIRILETKEQHEIDRILAELSGEVASIAYSVRLDYQNITELAFIFACGILSERLQATAPHVSEKRHVRLIQARHPLIDRDKVVPINVSLGEEYDTLIITGPNTGGKTVSLKTLGLFALMTQSGLHIPVEAESEICLFDRVLVDLGDEQSIEQSLSTFSSHMVNIVSILKEVGDRSLVLFDELGGGTDPVEGAALAVAIIESVREKGSLCAATTHYSELKAYALDTEGVCNASCEFDVETLKPTYKLIIGAPGKSNAFAISLKLGLPAGIVKRAEGYVSAENRQFEDIIRKLEESRVEMEKRREETEAMKAEYERHRREAEAVIARRLKDAENELERARNQATSMVQSAKASSEYIFEQLDKLQKQRESENLGSALDKTRREVRQYIRSNDDKYNPVDEKKNENYVLPRKLRKGDAVMIVNIGKQGVVLEEPDASGNVEVQAGIIKTRTKLKNLRLVEEQSTFTDKNDKKSNVSEIRKQVSRDCIDEIDLRGMTGDEAWFKADKYLDEAMLTGYHTVRLIHGKGTGALKAALWKYLKGDRRIKSFRIGQYGEGDGGVTVVELK